MTVKLITSQYHCRSLPYEDNLNIRNQIHCYYVMALGYSGLGKEELAEEYYEKVKRLDVNKQVFRM